MSQLEFFRTKSALKADFIEPTWDKYTDKNGQIHTNILRHGALYLEFAPGEDKVYDWTKKIGFAISFNDIPTILESFHKLRKNGELSLKLVHVPNKGKENEGKSKEISMFNGKNDGTYMITIKTDGKSITVPMKIGDILLLEKVFQDSIKIICGY